MKKERTKFHRKMWVYVNVLLPAIKKKKIAIHKHGFIVRLDGGGYMNYAIFDKMMSLPFDGKLYSNVMKDFLGGDWSSPDSDGLSKWEGELSQGYNPTNFLYGYEKFNEENPDTLSHDDCVFVIKLALRSLEEKIKE